MRTVLRPLAVSLMFAGLGLQAAAATDLVAALQAAQAKDPAYLGMLAGTQAGSAREAQARAMWMPSVALQAGAGYARQYSDTRGASFSAPAMGNMNNAEFVTDMRNASDARVGVELRQPLYSSERSASVRQLELQGKLAAQQRRLGEQNLKLRVASAYFEVLDAQENLRSLQAQKKAAGESRDIAAEMFRLGKRPSTDMNEAQAAFDAADAMVIAAQSQLELARARFRDLTGLPGEDLKPLRSDARLDALPAGELATRIEHAMAGNPAVGMRDTGAEIAYAEADKLKAYRATTLDLVARYDNARTDGSNHNGDASYAQRGGWVGVQLSVPLFTGGMRDARRDEAAALAEQARWQAQETRVQVTQELRAAWQGYTAGLAQVRAMEQGQRSAQLKLDSVRTGREQGARTMADELAAQQALQAALAALQHARLQVVMASLQLAAASGDLDEKSIDSVNALMAD